MVDISKATARPGQIKQVEKPVFKQKSKNGEIWAWYILGVIEYEGSVPLSPLFFSEKEAEEYLPLAKEDKGFYDHYVVASMLIDKKSFKRFLNQRK
ncbi:hypothetical protein [Scytonema sp. NUACC26]|uniref:hypothetical protein n=1 Tax=Scytonema sp. NUACC26 TaxID=3140176 RepID=UPI0034DBE7E2